MLLVLTSTRKTVGYVADASDKLHIALWSYSNSIDNVEYTTSKHAPVLANGRNGRNGSYLSSFCAANLHFTPRTISTPNNLPCCISNVVPSNHA